MKNQLSLKVKVLTLVLLSGLFVSLINGILAYRNSKSSLEDASRDKFSLTMSSKAEEIEKKINDMASSIRFFSKSLTTIEAMQEFTFAYGMAANQLRSKVSFDQTNTKLRSYYEDDFLKKFRELNAGKADYDYSTMTQNLNETSRLMQYAYIADNENILGEKNKLNVSKYDISYDKVHQRYHATFSKYLEEYKFYDAFLIDLQGNVVYTVYKELDFATNLNKEPVSKTGLAEVYRKALALKDESSFAMTDLAPYPVSYNVAAGFIAYPIKDESSAVIGVAVLQLDLSVINSIVSFDKKWKEIGMGNSGEAFIVGSDLILKTATRDIAESDKNNAYFSSLLDKGFSQEKIDEIKAKATNALNYKFDESYMKQIINSKESGFTEYTENKNDYFIAYKPLKVNDLRWYIVAKQEKSEILSGLNHLIKMILIQLACFTIALFVIGYYFSSSLSKELSQVVANLIQRSSRLSESSINIAQNSTELSESTTEQAASLQETVSSVDEISAMVSKSSDAAQTFKEVSEQSRGVAQKGKETVAEMILAIDQINESNLEITSEMESNSKEMKEIVRVITEIGNKTKVINDIVFQTKLLSFNASVEAARAGEHGKGFAVVAEEVGNLAQMSGKAADEISKMLNESVKKVETIARDTGVKVEKLIIRGKEKIDQGSRIANQCDQALNLILENVTKVNDMVSEISVASKEQSQGIQEITKAMSQLDQVTQQNASVAQSSSKSSEELSHEAHAVKDIATKLNFIVNGKIEIKNEQTSSNVKHSIQKEESAILYSMPIKEKKVKDVVPALKVSGGEEIFGSVPSKDDPRFEEV